MTRGSTLFVAGLLALLVAPAAFAQAPAKTPAPGQPVPVPAPPTQVGARPVAPPRKAAAALPTPRVPLSDSYSYHPEGRRDPFVSLINRGGDPRQPQRKAEGLSSLSVADAMVKGIYQGRNSFLAIVQGPDGKRPYIVRPNDRFADGVVKAITADSLIILQEVNDPLSLTKQREIRKTLRAVEEVK